MGSNPVQVCLQCSAKLAVESGFCLIDIGTEGSALSPERVVRVSETAGAE